MKSQYIEKNKYGTFYFFDKKMTKLHREDGPAIERADGGKEWILNGRLHREDGPAIERADGSKEWFFNGLHHREDGPAIETLISGLKVWFINGETHREDGPAVEWTNGNKLWFLNGNELTEAEFIRRTTKLELTLEEIAAKLGVDPKNLKIKK